MVGDEPVIDDLESILTHEFGHFFGLSNVVDQEATMSPTNELGETLKRPLEPDDVEGICAIYRPDAGRKFELSTRERARARANAPFQKTSVAHAQGRRRCAERSRVGPSARRTPPRTAASTLHVFGAKIAFRLEGVVLATNQKMFSVVASPPSVNAS